MDYIQNADDRKKLLKSWKELDPKNTRMLTVPEFIALLEKINVELRNEDSELLQSKFVMKNGKIVYENAIKELSSGIDFGKNKENTIDNKLNQNGELNLRSSQSKK